MPLKSQLESLLFVSLKPLSAKDLANLTQTKPKEVEEALGELSQEYETGERGLALVKNNNQYQLTTAGANAGLIKEFLKDETSGELSQPSLEALTIIAYRGPIAKLELDRIRGVNCALIIRNLLLRGLIEEKFEKSKNEYYYTVTHDFVRFLGLSEVAALPDYEKLHRTESIESVLSAGEDEK
ncbi:MAG: SMC-Scp complex subunit ScpB [Patescibacteria group bacterium]